jgi:hypothetical protein
MKKKDKKIEVVVVSRYKEEGFTADSTRLSTKGSFGQIRI